MNETYTASDSNALEGQESIGPGIDSETGFDFPSDELFSSAGVPGEYELTVISRLDTISISCIISTCILFLLLLRSYK